MFSLSNHVSCSSPLLSSPLSYLHSRFCLPCLAFSSLLFPHLPSVFSGLSCVFLFTLSKDTNKPHQHKKAPSSTQTTHVILNKTQKLKTKDKKKKNVKHNSTSRRDIKIQTTRKQPNNQDRPTNTQTIKQPWINSHHLAPPPQDVTHPRASSVRPPGSVAGSGDGDGVGGVGGD